MAIVSKETIYCFKKEFKRVVRYKSRYSKFYIKLPDGVPQEEVESDTEAGAIRLFDAAVDVYEKSSTVKSKVILYGYEVEACIPVPNDKKDHCTILFDSHDDCNFGKTFRDDGITLSLWVQACEKSEVFLKGQDNYVSYDEIDSPIPSSLEPSSSKNYNHWDNFQEIPWTPENEQFFIDVGIAFEQLVLKLNSVFCDKKSVMKFISAGQKLLGDNRKDSKNAKSKNTKTNASRSR